MRVLHTSDWHLGRSLINKKRLPEQVAFLDWLIAEIERRQIAVLLVAGDVFDTATPGTAAQKVYYSFLRRLLGTSCRHVVIIAGNHDSPSFLAAPSEILGLLGVHVLSAAAVSAVPPEGPANPEDPDDFENPVNSGLAEEVLVLTLSNDLGEAPPQHLIVCAVPYLRDRDIRVSEAGESLEDKDWKSLEGIRRHYAAVGALAEQKRRQYGEQTPVVVMGHLFAAGGHIVEGDGVRELSVGSLVSVPADVFPAGADYVALGHLHSPQGVAGCETIRYSGAPLSFGFGEAGHEKSVCVLTLTGRELEVEKVPVPVFQKLASLRGDLPALLESLEALKSANESVWVEVEYAGLERLGARSDVLGQAVAGSPVELLRIRDATQARQIRSQDEYSVSLEDLSVAEVFRNCLRDNAVPESQWGELVRLHDEIFENLEHS